MAERDTKDEKMDQDELLAELERLRGRVAELEKDQVRLRSTEQALLRSVDRLRSLFEMSYVAYQSLDESGSYVDCNDQLCQLLGYSRSELLGRRFEEFWDRKTKHLFEAKFREFKEVGTVGGELTLAHKDGSIVHVLITGIVQLDEQGRFFRTHCTLRDISDRKLAERLLRETDRRYQSLFEDAPLMYVITRNQGGVPYIEDCNELFVRAVGWLREELVGKPLADFYSAKSKADLLEGGGYVRALAGEYLMGERELLTAQGTLVATLLYTTPEKDVNGRVIGTRAMFVDITDRKRAEAKLKEAYDIINLSPSVAFLWKNAEGWPVEFVTDNVEALFGYTAQEFASGEMPYSRTVHPDDLERVAYEVATYSAEVGRSEFHHEPYRIVTKEGETKWVDDSTVIRRNQQGEITHYQGLLLDITARKEAEEELQKNLDALKRSEEIAHLGYFERNWQSGEAYWSDGFCRLLGLPPGCMMSHDRFVTYIHDDDRERVTAHIKTSLQDREPMDIEFRLVQESGAIVNIHGIADNTYDRDNTPRFTRGTFQDITEVKQTERALKESEKRYRFLADNTLDVIWQMDLHLRFTYVNPAIYQLTGYTHDEWIGTRLPDHCDEENFRKMAQVVSQEIAKGPNGAGVIFEAVMLKKNKEIVPVEIHGKVIYREDGTPMGLQGTTRDISERKIMEKQLFEAQKMEAVGTLAGGVAHDFNNLLQIISGHAELLEIELNEKDMRFSEVTAIRQASDRGADLVKQILTFSRRLDVQFESINLNEDVTDTERLLYRTIPKMIDIELKLDDRLRPVQADSTQVEQMLINLAVNAKDAMPEGGRLTIETRNVTLDTDYCRGHRGLLPGQYVQLTVSDTGHGMEQDVLQHIFEPFFTTKGLADGTGLGLATVFGIVKMHGGYITCESTVGIGTTFDIYFPVAEADKPDVNKEHESPPVAGGTETILVVDDEPMIRELATRILQKAGYSIITAGSGKEALEIYAQKESDIALVILDLIMPEMGGIQCLEKLLEIDPQVKALIASGFAIKGDTKSFLDKEAKGKVAKPFNMRDLLRSVRHVLDGV